MSDRVPYNDMNLMSKDEVNEILRELSYEVDDERVLAQERAEATVAKHFHIDPKQLDTFNRMDTFNRRVFIW